MGEKCNPQKDGVQLQYENVYAKGHADPDNKLSDNRIQLHTILQPIPVATRSKVRVCGRSLAGIVGSNPAGGMFVSC